ncbi:hypothetical protein PQU92_01635 [Asticcacaulis sp. BYS171W]|uniref:Uncharacterized protein n=1 Tax=Asticcacaulis aquaticus TaxID=2984212 RepID=A0ABT5HPJ0_9CAUL|nr:hypothetical protein [Asticcacaulis aquaticus]MDC7681959.1 hypothetical protein [Asticcacaulis aquaticus]
MRIALFALATMLAAPAAFAAEPETHAFQLEVGRDRCTLNYPRTDGRTLTFLLHVDGTFSASIHQNRWEIVDDKDTKDQSKPMTLEFKGVGKTTAKWGGYRNGYVQGLWAGWDKNPSGPASTGEAMGLLEKAQVVSVTFEGKPMGTFDMKNKGFAAMALRTCARNVANIPAG